MGKPSRSSGCSLAHLGSATFLFALTILSALALLAFQLSVSTKWGRDEFWGDLTDDLTVDSETLQHVKRGYFVRGSSALTIIWWWGVPLLATLASIALLQLPARRAVFRRMKGVTNLLGREVTVGNWKLCNCYLARKAGVESFKVGEAVMIVVFLLVNVLGAHRVYLRFLEHYLMHKDDDFVPPPEWAKKWDAVNFAIGYASFVNFTIIFFPVARNSPLFDLMGLSFEKRIKYHRWLAHFSMWIVTAHGMSYWLLWLVRSEWVELAFEQGNHTDNLAGAISILFGWALWFTSLEFFRRKFFEIFYRFHIVCFLGFAIFANLHVPGYTSYLPAGLLLYTVDVVLRVVQQSAPVEVETSINSDGTVAALSVQAAKGLSTMGTPVIWVSCPSISSCQWHPVTPIVSSDGKLSIYFKVYGNWTKELCEKSANGKLAHLHIEGPHDIGTDGLASDFMEYNSLIFFAGGIAITPFLAILEAFNSSDINLDQNKPSIYLYWTVRGVAELEAGLLLLRNFMGKHPDLLVLEVYVTGKNQTPEKQEILPCRDEEPCFFQRLKSTLRRYIGRTPTPVLVPAKQGPLHLSILYIVAYGAGFAGLLLGRAWRLEHMQAGEKLKLGNNNAVQFTLTFIMAIGWITLCVLPLHILRTTKARQDSEQQSKQHQSVKKGITALASDWKDGEVHEQRHIGRPNFDSILQGLKSRGIDKNSTAVIAGGPSPMVTAVRQAALSASMKFHEASFEF